MSLRYFDRFKSKKSKEEKSSDKPVLNEEDEKFLAKITSEETAPPLPERPTVILDNGKELKGKDAQTALMDGANEIPLPVSPPVRNSAEEKKRKDYWAFLPSIPGSKSKKKEKAAAEATKSGESTKDTPEQDTKEEEADLTSILDQLNLSAVNNRVFSFSKESQELLEKFNQVLKDIVNGVPTAYDDLEKLLTNSENQLQKLYGGLPPFLQTLVKSLPSKMTAVIGPEILAAAAEKPSVNAASLDPESSKGASRKKHKKSRVPSLKSLVTQQGAVAGMLKSILNFLKLRFPAFITGTNVLMSLAVFLLLFVFWYCHKRGRETRLERESKAAEGSDLERSSSDLGESSILEKSAVQPEQGESSATAAQPPAAIEDKPNVTVDDMPSVLNLPDPASIPLPADKGEAGK